MTNSSDSPSAEFDYVVIGGGTAGCVVAARLSEDPAVSVCVLEAGPSDVGDEDVLRLERWMHLLGSGYDWDCPIEPQPRGNSHLRHARARVLGGCSSHNSAIAFWAPAEDLDEWGTLGCTGWSAADCFPLYQRLENNDAPGEHHGRNGPVRIRSVPPVDRCGAALLAACAQTGIPTTEFNSGKTVTRGANWFQINAFEDNTRSSASVSYVHPALGRPNLDVRNDVRVKRLTFDGLRCTGTEYLTADLLHSARVTARREVVLSCGSFDTPKVLMLSGIGPAQHLRDVGVEVLLDAPGVGENLQDHPEGIVQWDALRPMPQQSTQFWEIGIFATTVEGLDRPDLMFHYGSVPFDMNTARWGYPTTENGFCLTPNVTRARSTGTVRLRTRDFRDKPRVDPRYFTDEHDMPVLVHGVKLARQIAAQPALAPWVGRELAPGPQVRSDDEIADFVSRTHNTVYHPSCTVPMGPDSDPMAPLDPRLRVKGIAGLRVADGSAMPFLVAVNPCITTMMIGEKCADMIREDAG
ncbi:MAG TPA: GMC family oxidoreductase N-terminal domain-containing protein [Pseudonocardiaceae bacterium]